MRATRIASDKKFWGTLTEKVVRVQKTLYAYDEKLHAFHQNLNA